MKIKMIKLVILLFGLFSHFSYASLLDGFFPEDRKIFIKSEPLSQYRLTLGGLKKINGILTAEREVLLTGKIERRTIEVKHFFSLPKAWNHIVQNVGDLGANLLFECREFDCGSSNSWANDRFKIKQLYGLDQFQRYAAWEFSQNDTKFYLAAYLVKRGNKRLYAQLDLIQSSAQSEPLPDLEVIQDKLARDSFFILPGVQFDEKIEISSSMLQVITQVLSNLGSQDFYLVGHSYKSQTLEEKTELSLDYAKALLKLFEENGVRKGQLEAKGVGSLAPELKHGEAIVLVKK